MQPKALPIGAMPFAVYHTLRVAAYFELHDHMAFELGLGCLMKIKACFGAAYPGAHDEIDLLVEEHRQLIQELLTLYLLAQNNWDPVEKRLLSIYPEITGRPMVQMMFLFHMLMRKSEGYTVDGDAL